MMPRPQRLEYENALYHVMNRGRGQQMIFREPEDYENFLHTLDEAHERFGLQAHAYCLMGNHYHLLVNPPAPTLTVLYFAGASRRCWSKRIVICCN